MKIEELRETDIVSAAHWYCEQGLAIIPLIGKRPAYGDDWWTRAITDPVVAAVEFGSDSRYSNIGWCQGYGTVAVDVDEPELLPAEVRDAIRPGALNLTRRNPDRGHRIFASEVAWSASTAGFPARGWGEVRGRGGQIVIWGPHPATDGFYCYDATQKPPLLTHDLHGWLIEAGSYEHAATDSEVSSFLLEHDGTNLESRESPNGVAHWLLEKEAEGVGLHELLVSALTWGFREARQGHYPALDAHEAVQSWWEEAWRRRADDTTGARREPARGEWDGAVRWAVAQAMLEDRGEAAVEPTPDERLLDWTPGDVAALLDGGLEPSPSPELLEAHEEGVGLLYPGQINCLYGDSGTGKSWVAALAAKQEMERGGVVLWVDLEQTFVQCVERMQALQTDSAALRERFLRIAPRDDIRADVSRALELVDEHAVSMVVLDSLGESFAIDGVAENNDDEVGPWQREVLRRITDDTEAKPQVLVIDHSTKAAEAPLFPSGSKRKRAGWTGAGYLVTSDGFSKSEAGWIRLTVAKDRHGARPAGSYALQLHVKPEMNGTKVSIEPHEPPPEELPAGPADLTDTQERREMVRELCIAFEALLAQDQLTELRSSVVRQLVPKGSGSQRTAVMELAVAHGWLDVETRDHGAKWYALNRTPPGDWVLDVAATSPGSEGF